ncbi:hypothetical protein [Desulfobacter postgatei]|uniref:hypothetical protein n=1 Tax=Desulfobacter postgatei TaxID=2293 RepID=UPI00259B18BF|nr:hypothetical protein [uncultured Desulfobacter sp.]
MDIKSIQGMNAYTANTLTTDTADVQNNLKEKQDVKTNTENTQTTQEAFQVNITQQALELQAENTEEPVKQNEEQLFAQQTYQVQPLQGPQGSRIDIFG